VDECLSSPCQNNYTCVDRVGGYECTCDPAWPCHVTPVLKNWQIGLITGIAAAVLLVFVCLAEIYFFNFRKRCFKWVSTLAVCAVVYLSNPQFSCVMELSDEM